jgi:hypothetical protein
LGIKLYGKSHKNDSIKKQIINKFYLKILLKRIINECFFGEMERLLKFMRVILENYANFS